MKDTTGDLFAVDEETGRAIFNKETAEAARDAGMETALTPEFRKIVLASAQEIALELGRRLELVSADDVVEAYQTRHGRRLNLILGNAMGSIFRGSEWVCAGYRQSTRVDRHAGSQKVWRLRRP